MTLAQFLVALAARIAAIETAITEISNMQGMTPEQAAQLAQAVNDIASLRVSVDNLSGSFTSVQSQVTDLSAVVQAAAAAHAGLRATVEAQGEEIAQIVAAVGDLGSLPPI